MQAISQSTRRQWISTILGTFAIAIPVWAIRRNSEPKLTGSPTNIPQQSDLEQWLVGTAGGRVPAHVAALVRRSAA